LVGGRFDALRPQRLAAPAKVYVEQFSAHPLEAESQELYGPPDGYLASDGTFSHERRNATDKSVYEIEIKPEDGLYPLPYMARQKDGSAWEHDFIKPGSNIARQPFFPDGSRSFEEIDRLSVGMDDHASLISTIADIDFYRIAPPGGYTKGLSAEARTDIGTGDFQPILAWLLGVQKAFLSLMSTHDTEGMNPSSFLRRPMVRFRLLGNS
jgi:L-asparaginase